MRKITILFYIFFCTLLSAMSQECVIELDHNPAIIRYLDSNIVPKKTVTGSLSLPFFDNFKKLDSPYPNAELWADRYAYINDTYQLFPPNRGVATLDALDENGRVFKHANEFGFYADSLTSNPIRLDSIVSENRKITLNDSLYFSFFYQPQGRGNQPEYHDSLFLEFREAELDGVYRWKRVWEVKGSQIDSFQIENKAYFKTVMLYLDHNLYRDDIVKMVARIILDYIREYKEQNGGKSPSEEEIRLKTEVSTIELNNRYDSIFYHSNFQFRFVNKASISPSSLPGWQANCDNWNIDNVYLNINRTFADTLFNEIGFIEPAKSFLKNFTAVPYYQYNNNPIAYLAESISTSVKNGFPFDLDLFYKYKVYDSEDNLLYTYSASKPVNAESFATDPAIANPPVQYIFPVNDPSLQPYRIEQTVSVNDEYEDSNDQYNDKINYSQEFSDYFSYDDGTAEAGYGMKGIGTKCAYKFSLNTSDTLIGVQIYFNNTLTDGNEKPFNIAVWRDNYLGSPGEEVYINSTASVPSYNGYNEFVQFDLDDEVEVRPPFLYVGWVQINKENLDMGWDRSNPQRENIFVFIPGEGVWRNTDYDDGCLMIRPVFKSGSTSVENIGSNNKYKFKLFPNPVNGGVLNINNDISNFDASDFEIFIYDFFGRVVYNSVYKENIILDVPNGSYLVRFVNKNDGISRTYKIMVAR